MFGVYERLRRLASAMYLSSRTSMHALCPRSAAACSAVDPHLTRVLTSLPDCIKISQMFVWPWQALQYKGVALSLSHTFVEHPDLSKLNANSKFPFLAAEINSIFESSPYTESSPHFYLVCRTYRMVSEPSIYGSGPETIEDLIFNSILPLKYSRKSSFCLSILSKCTWKSIKESNRVHADVTSVRLPHWRHLWANCWFLEFRIFWCSYSLPRSRHTDHNHWLHDVIKS